MNNQKGSILQVVLVIFMILNIFVLTLSKTVIENGRGVQRIKEINDARILEISILYHLKHEAKQDTLFTRTLQIEDCLVGYTVVSIDDRYQIEVIVRKTKEEYAFTLLLMKDTLMITELTYQ